MEKAKQAVSGFLSKDGKHNTTVHETVNPSIQHENVTPTRHENVTTAVDREVHQDHYHTSVQPIQHKEVLPESHTHQIGGVEHRNIKHGNDDHIAQRLKTEAAQFKDRQEVGETQHTSTAAPTMTGEHVHHHVHESIQPIIQKETVQPSVVHTTVPVHEVHQNEAKHHTATQLPAVSMDQFRNQGGSLHGREERTDAFNGEPRTVGGTIGGDGAKGTTSLTQKNGASGVGNSGALGSREQGLGHGATGHNHNGNTGNLGSGSTNDGAYGNNAGLTGSQGHGRGTDGNGVNDVTGKKPSLMDRLNPMKDADGDGKKGVMN